MPLATADEALPISSTTMHQVTVSDSRSAVGLRRGHPQESEFAKLAVQSPVELRMLIDRLGLGRDVPLRKRSGDVANLLLLRSHPKVHEMRTPITP